MKWTFFSGITAALLISNPAAFAQNTKNKLLQPLLDSPGNWFVSMGAGAQYPLWHNPMVINNGSGFLAPSDKDLYATKNESSTVLALSTGKRWQRDNFWFPAYSLGVFWQYLFRTNLGSTITQYSIPEFTNYKYNWELTSNLLLASAKLNLFRYAKLSPYVNGGIGSSFNRTSNYREAALPGVTARTSPGFGNFSTSEFAYNIGAGIDFQVNPQLILSVGYNYQNLGQISSGAGKENWFNQSLNPGSYHSNEFLISASYFFGKNNEDK